VSAGGENYDEAAYPEELERWVARLEEWDRLRAQALARARAAGHDRPIISPRAFTDFLALALASGVVGNVGYDLLKAALRQWRRSRVRLPELARDRREAVLLAVLATQARCAQVDLPVPPLAELEAIGCIRTPDGWRVELRRQDYGRSVRGERPWPAGVALGATVRVPDGPLVARDIEVTVVAKREVDDAVREEHRRIVEFIERLGPPPQPPRQPPPPPSGPDPAGG
jgi:hypothetical protein